MNTLKLGGWGSLILPRMGSRHQYGEEERVITEHTFCGSSPSAAPAPPAPTRGVRRPPPRVVPPFPAPGAVLGEALQVLQQVLQLAVPA